MTGRNGPELSRLIFGGAPIGGLYAPVADAAADGAFAMHDLPAHPGEEIDVPFFTDDDASKEIEVAVDTGEAFATEKIRVRAGERSRHVVKLRAAANP